LSDIIDFLKKLFHKRVEEQTEEIYSFLQPDFNEYGFSSDSSYSSDSPYSSDEDNSIFIGGGAINKIDNIYINKPIDEKVEKIYNGSSYIDRLNSIMSEDEILEEAMKKWRK
jgi:hypothetical protein